MCNAIGWYLTELRLLLTPHMKAGRVVEICHEARCHLELEAERLRAQLDLGPEEAAWLAIEAFGEPARIARTYVRESGRSVFGLPSAWAVLGGALVAILCWDFHWMTLEGPFDHFGDTWQNGVAAIVGAFALVLFVLGCRASFRWNGLRLGALTAGIALLAIPLLSVWIVSATGFPGPVVSRLHLARDRQRLNETLVRLEALELYLKKGKTVFANAKSISDLPLAYKDPDAAAAILGRNPGEDRSVVLGAFRQGWRDPGQRPREELALLPTGYVFAMVDGRIYALETADFSMAKEAWRNPTGSEESVSQGRAAFQDLLGAVDEASHGRLFFWAPWPALIISVWTMSAGIALMLVDASVWLLVRRRRARPGMALA